MQKRDREFAAGAITALCTLGGAYAASGWTAFTPIGFCVAIFAAFSVLAKKWGEGGVLAESP